MQWEASRNAGFSSAEKTWLTVNQDYQTVNVETEQKTANSLLNTLRELLKIRNKSSALRGGSLKLVSRTEVPDHILMFNRKSGNEELLVVMNFNKNDCQFDFKAEDWVILFGLNVNDRLSDGKIKLDGFGGMILGKNPPV